MDPAEEQRLFRLLQVDATLQQEALPERKADALRILAFELQLSELSGCPAKLGPCATNIFQEQYENIVDCSDETSGLGNFAPGALSLCATNRNERDKWTSALTQNTLSTMRCVKDFLTRYQSESRKIVPHLDSKPVRSTSSELATCSGGPIFDSLATRSEMIPSARGCDSAVRVPTFSWKTFSERPHASSPDVQTESLQSSSFPLTGQKAGIHHSRGATTHDDLDDNPDEAEGQGPSKCVSKNAFRTAREQLVMDQVKTYGQCHGQPNFSYGSIRKSLGTRRGPSSRFIPPVLTKDSENDAVSSFGSSKGSMPNKSEEPVDERLKGIEPKIIELISNEIMDHRPQMDWEDIAGLQFAKKTIKEIVVWPMLRPDIFTGLRGPPKGLLLFGPPGTGKTLIGKCIASQSKSTFFCISASSLTSKWVGEGEKMVRALFAVARCHQPAVIFIDEVDSLLAQRSEGEHESSRRIKTEFLVQLDGATTDCEDRILVIGATNRPQEIDEAARRRFVKRLYIPLPELVARVHIVTQLMAQQHCQLTQADITLVGQRTEGYSGADMASLCREAALGPIRTIPLEQIEHIHPEQVPPITLKDFEAALPQVRPSVSDKDLEVYIKWNNTFGSFGQG